MTAKDLLQGKSIFDLDSDVTDTAYRLKYNKSKILVTGACGSIGRAVYTTLKRLGMNVHGIDRDEREVANMRDVELCDFRHFDPKSFDMVIHCAAYKHVTLGERYHFEFAENNTLQTIDFFEKCKGKFVFVSTDKAAGTSWMGKTKREAEEHIVGAWGWAIRLVNCAYSRGSVLDIWTHKGTNRIADKDTQRYWMQINDAVFAILNVSFLDPGLYTINGAPIFTLGEIQQAYEELYGPCEWVPKALGPGEVKEERLVNDSEHILESNAWASRIINK